MDPIGIQTKLLWSLILIISSMCSGTYSDMGKLSSSQNHFGSAAQSHFTTKNSTRVIAQKGGLAILPCVVKLTSPATVSWIRRNDFQLLTVGLSTHSSDKRFLVEHTRHMGHWSLRIKSVRDEDRGLYECQLSIYPTQSIFVELKVVEAVAEIVGAPDLHIDEGSTLRLECKLRRATENPTFVFWYHDSKMVNYDAQDGFSVTSTATNSSNLLDSESTTFGVRSANLNKMRGINYSKRNYSNINNSNSKFLNVQSPLSAPLVMPQSHQSSYLISPSSSILTLQEVHFHHAGNYTCAPSNARPASITVHVLRGERPAAMQHANRSLFDNDNNNSSIGINGTSTSSHACSLNVHRPLLTTMKKFVEVRQYLQTCMDKNDFFWVLSTVTLILTYHKIKR